MEELESSPERKAEFEEASSKLPEGENPVAAGINEALLEALESMVFRILPYVRGRR